MHVLTKNLVKIYTNIWRNSFIQTEKSRLNIWNILPYYKMQYVFFQNKLSLSFLACFKWKMFWKWDVSSHDLWQHEILFLFNWDKIYSWYQQQYKYFESTNTDIAHSLWSLNWHCHLSQVSIQFSNHFILKQVIKI